MMFATNTDMSRLQQVKPVYTIIAVINKIY